MATSTNYGWTEPDNTGLVKNGAQDMRTLGNAIDTSVWNVGFGQAGKNKIINGDFGIWQRGTSFTTNGAYTADRWVTLWDGTGTKTISQQTFTPGAAPVAGYESQYFLRFNQTVAGTGSTYNVVNQRIEDVRTFAGQPVTISFWAKASGSISMASAPSLNQNFGSGGSATTYPGFTGTAPALTTSWQRFSFTTTVPSITGKTVGTSSYLEIGFNLPLNTTFTIDIWGAQLEYGSKATPFVEAGGGSPQAELAMCQRYYYRQTSASNYTYFGGGFAASTTQAKWLAKLPVTMRTSPSFSVSNATNLNIGAAASQSVTSITLDQANPDSVGLFANCTSGLVAGQSIMIIGNNSSAPFIEYSSEL